jgi:hypothetical protein
MMCSPNVISMPFGGNRQAPHDAARNVEFLVDADNRCITGGNVLVDGRLTLSVLTGIPGIARRKDGPL